MGDTPEHFDVIIVGAGISGISMAAHMKLRCPQFTYAIVEKRERLGGTWDLFRYPGVRSDSDMHTLGFRFEPWVNDKAIADGPAILDYLDQVVTKYGIRPNIRFEHAVLSASWSSECARWRLEVQCGGERRAMTCRMLYLASGYYDYDEPHDPRLAGIDSFAGQVIHPQFWPKDLDYSGKHVVVIGSGATAVTIVPAMAAKAAHVTMLQRTPTWMSAGPSRDNVANILRKLLPARLAYRLTRAKNVALHQYFFKKARSEPEKVAPWLTGKLRDALGEKYNERDFLPPYPPWDQRLCLVPDGDLFQAIKEGKASVKTGQIAGIEPKGIRLASGELVEADIIVTATGLRLSLGGKIAITLDGEKLEPSEHWFYRSAMLSNVPNFVGVFGYLNASWTLRADNTAEYACRLLKAMREKKADIAMPYLAENHGLEEVDPIPFSSGYLQRARHLLPRMAATLPWRLGMDYREDCRDLRLVPVEDGVLRIQTVAAAAEVA